MAALDAVVRSSFNKASSTFLSEYFRIVRLSFIDVMSSYFYVILVVGKVMKSTLISITNHSILVREFSFLFIYIKVVI